MMWWNDYYWHMPWVFAPLMMFLMLALCIGVMWIMMRGMGRHGGRYNYPLDILKERFARGEVTQAEYEERRRILDA